MTLERAQILTFVRCQETTNSSIVFGHHQDLNAVSRKSRSSSAHTHFFTRATHCFLVNFVKAHEPWARQVPHLSFAKKFLDVSCSSTAAVEAENPFCYIVTYLNDAILETTTFRRFKKFWQFHFHNPKFSNDALLSLVVSTCISKSNKFLM